MGQMTFGSLFAGIGALDLGLQRAGLVCKWQVEVDPYATRVLTKQWPDVPKFGDVRECGQHNLPAVDLIAGGFPCQDISAAGKRIGMSGERSGLWSEFARIIRELRPRYVFVENVPTLLCPVRRRRRIVELAPLGRVLGDLAACGYDAEWQVLSAAAFGAPHLRERVFLVAYPNVQEWVDELGEQQSQSCPETTSVSNTRQRVGVKRSRVFSPEKGTRGRYVHFWESESEVPRVADGVTHRMDRGRGIGNAVLPQISEFVGVLITAFDEAR